MTASEAKAIAELKNLEPLDKDFIQQIFKKIESLSRSGRYDLTLKDDEYNIYNRAFLRELKDNGYAWEFDGKGSVMINWKNAKNLLDNE